MAPKKKSDIPLPNKSPDETRKELILEASGSEELANALVPTPQPPQEPELAPGAKACLGEMQKGENLITTMDGVIDDLKAKVADLEARLAAQPVPAAKVATSTLPATDKEGRKLAWATGIPTITKTASPQ